MLNVNYKILCFTSSSGIPVEQESEPQLEQKKMAILTKSLH